MKTCRKGLHQYEGRQCLECVRVRTSAPEYRAENNEYHRVRRSTPEYKANLAEYHRARWATPEYRAKSYKYKRDRYANDPETRAKHAERHRAWKYGLAPGERDAMLTAQGYMCANDGCKSTEPAGRNWHIDHCHNTGKVRGILCHPCNTALGQVKDSIERLHGLANYLETHA